MAIANAAPCEEKGDTVVSAVPEMDDPDGIDMSIEMKRVGPDWKYDTRRLFEQVYQLNRMRHQRLKR